MLLNLKEWWFIHLCIRGSIIRHPSCRYKAIRRQQQWNEKETPTNLLQSLDSNCLPISSSWPTLSFDVMKKIWFESWVCGHHLLSIMHSCNIHFLHYVYQEFITIELFPWFGSPELNYCLKYPLSAVCCYRSTLFFYKESECGYSRRGQTWEE